ncbi:MAG: hypothetical protein JO352_27420 [Chloroflexi bacterium]|nr:hypothetical protein [Chloroflexota bacterium]MBV9602106.1 hypothetical protein [Chloroflexota bacterium]
MARRKLRAEQDSGSERSPTNTELTLEVSSLLASIDGLTEFWPKDEAGKPVPLGHASMPAEAADRISQALSSISGSVAKAAAVLEQTAHGLGPATDPATAEAHARLQSATSFLRDLGILTPDQPEPVKPPPILPQQTAPEVKAAAMGLADGPKLRRWEPIEGEIALRHAVRGSALETKLVSHPLLDWLGLPNTIDNLRAELRRAGLPAVLLLHVVIGTALDKLVARRLYVDVSIDDLIEAIGWDPRSRSERESQRRTVWRWISLFDAMKVIGRRPGKYRDPDTREVIDLTSDDALIRITGRRVPAQLALDDSVPPLEVTYVAGPWIEQWRGNHQVLTYFGDVRKLGDIPARRPSGAWAQAIGLALQQCWRERSADADVARVGDHNILTVRFKPFTRRELLDMFPPSPTVGDVLQSGNPKRAQEYWREAITQLKRARVVGFYKEVEELPDKRQGWADAWLTQPLDIRPAEEGRQAIAQIAQRARRARRPRAASSSVG